MMMICPRFFSLNQPVTSRVQRFVCSSSALRNAKTPDDLDHESTVRERYAKRMKEMEDVKMKSRHIGLLGGFFAVLFGTQAYVLWKRQSENRDANKKMPPIKFEEFKHTYLSKGNVASLVFHPNFKVIDVFFGDISSEQKSKKTLEKFLGTFSTGPEKFAPVPDLRVTFEGKVEDLEKAVLEAQKQMEGPSAIHIENNSYPSFRELALVIGSSVTFVVALAVALK